MIGFSEKFCKWLESYLIGRVQFVQIRVGKNRYNSVRLLVLGGVPQGSVIAALLFILFINDLAAFLNKKISVDVLKSVFMLLLFADDILFVISSQLLENLEIDANIIMNFLLQWCKLCFLSFNDEKTVYMLIQRRVQHDQCFSIFVGDRQIEEVQALKYLGLYLDNKMTFEKHIENVRSKLRSAIFVLRVLSKFCEVKILLLAYHALVGSHLNYCVNTWAFASGGKLKSVFTLQKKAIRAIFKLSCEESCREYFQRNEILTLPGLISLNYLKLLKANLNNGTQEIGHSYNTRNKEISALMKQSVYMAKSEKVFNKLPDIVKSIPIADPLFLNKAKEHILNDCPYNFNEF